MIPSSILDTHITIQQKYGYNNVFAKKKRKCKFVTDKFANIFTTRFLHN